MVGAWKIWKRRASGQWHLRYVVAGVAAGIFLLLPFLVGFGRATGYMELQLVHGAEHAPLIQFLIVFWPLLVLALAVPFVGRVIRWQAFWGRYFSHSSSSAKCSTPSTMATQGSSFGSILPLNGGAGSLLEACSRFRPACWPVIAASSGALPPA